MESVIAVENLSKRYGSLEALNGISFTVPKGAIYGVLGANGAGKTTLMKALVGAVKIDSGEVAVLGKSVHSHRRQLYPEIGYMPQFPALYEDLSALDNVAFFARAHPIKNPLQRAKEAIGFVNLEERQHDAVFTFSGGMKQRISLACALVHQPRVLFLDEPTAGVDPKLKERFWQYFRELAASGVTIFMSTHLMDEALLCDRLTILRSGKILASDTPKEIMSRGKVVIRLHREGGTEEITVDHYPDRLPEVLRRYGLNPDIQKIEVEEQTLESIIVGMIEGEV